MNVRMAPTGLQVLDQLAAAEKLTRSAAVRQAVDDWVRRQHLPAHRRKAQQNAEALLHQLACWQQHFWALAPLVPPDAHWPPADWDGDPTTLPPPDFELLAEPHQPDPGTAEPQTRGPDF